MLEEKLRALTVNFTIEQQDRNQGRLDAITEQLNSVGAQLTAARAVDRQTAERIDALTEQLNSVGAQLTAARAVDRQTAGRIDVVAEQMDSLGPRLTSEQERLRYEFNQARNEQAALRVRIEQEISGAKNATDQLARQATDWRDAIAGERRAENEAAAEAARQQREAGQEFTRELAGLRDELSRLCAALSELRDGPGDPQVPQPLESYRGFRLIRHKGRVQAVPERSESAAAVLDSASPDLVKARIDAYLAEQAVHQLADQMAGAGKQWPWRKRP
jgi:chromosome segregation ATPase